MTFLVEYSITKIFDSYSPTRIQTLVEDSKNVRAVDTALDVTSSWSLVHCSVPDEPVQQGNWVTNHRQLDFFRLSSMAKCSTDM